jgi:hypothetical protein
VLSQLEKMQFQVNKLVLKRVILKQDFLCFISSCESNVVPGVEVF